MLFFLFHFQSTTTETPLDLSKKLEEEYIMMKLHESRPLDLSQKTVTVCDREDTKPLHSFIEMTQHLTRTIHSFKLATQSRGQQNLHSSYVKPVLSSPAANVLSSGSTALVQKVSPVQLQPSSCMAGKQIDSSTKTYAIAVAQRLSQRLQFSSQYRISDCTGCVKSSHSGSRNISVVKPAASSVSDTRLLSSSVQRTVTDNSNASTLQPIYTSQKISPHFGTATPMSFDAGRTDRSLPLAQVYPTCVVITAQSTTETVPSPIQCNKEILGISPSNKMQVLDKDCPSVCAPSAFSNTKTSSHVEAVAALPVLTSDSCNTIKSSVFVPNTCTDVSPPMPILSPNFSSSSFVNHATPFTVSPEPHSTKFTSGKGILPPVETSPLSLSDRESIPDEYDSGHELFSTHMEWDDNSMLDRKDSSSDTCQTEEVSIKRPAFEVVGDCNRTLLSDISWPCCAAVAFDRSLLQNQSDHRNFIMSTKYYRFLSPKSYPVSGGPHDLDVVQPDTCSSPNVSSSTSQELRLPTQLSSVLKGSSTSKSKSRALPTARQLTFTNGGKDGHFNDSDDIRTTYDLAKESNCKYGLLDKKLRKLHHQRLQHDDTVRYNVIGSIYSSTFRSSPKRGSRVVPSNSVVQVKSEVNEASDGPESKPNAPARTVCQRRKKNIPAEIHTGTSNGFDKIVGSMSEANSTVSEWDRDSCRSAQSIDVESTAGFDHTMHAVTDSVAGCNESVLTIRPDSTKMSEDKMHCKQDLPPESADVNGSLNSGRKNPRDKVPSVRQRKSGDANNNQGETVNHLAVSASTTSANEREHLNDVHQLIMTETRSVGRLQSECAQQNGKVPVHTCANTTSSKSDITATHNHRHKTFSSPRPQRMRADSKWKESSQSANVASLLSSRKSDETVSKRTPVAPDTNQQKFRSFRQLNKCTKEQSSAKVDVSSVTSSDVTDARTKAQHAILRQLKSSEGYIAEKNIKYSKSEDLFDDSSLLSREQRALRVGKSFDIESCVVL